MPSDQPTSKPNDQPSQASPLTYAAAGLDYDPLDNFKRACQQFAGSTQANLARHGLREPAATRGESVYLIETPSEYIAHVEEALGTKTLVADAMYKLTGKSFYRNVAIDDVSTIVNDLVVSGARALSVAMYAGVGDSSYFSDKTRADDLAKGFAEACNMAGAVWSGGETQTLKGMINPETIILGGSAIGRIAPKSLRIAGNIQHGDDIVLFASSGVHTNGLTLCRALTQRLEKGYLTPITQNGPTYGQALLAPSVIYADMIAAAQDAGINIRYAVHLTGHGWRKLMRLPDAFVYRVEELPKVPDLFAFINRHANLDDREAYGTFNMGAGFVLYVSPKDTPAVLKIAKQLGHTAWRGGTVIKDGPRKAVELTQPGLTFDADSLHIR